MEVKLQLTRRRWVILTVFALYSMMNEFQWIQYSVISDKIASFYGVPLMAVDWLSMIFMLLYIFLIFPATWLLDKKGLRLTALLGSFTQFLGAAVKCFSPYSNRFWVTFLGQTFCALSQVFILGIPARLASLWFAEREVPFATSVGVFGNQLGVALGFFLVPLIVPTVVLPTRNESLLSEDIYDKNLGVLFYSTTAVTGLLFLLVIFVFQDRPFVAPNPAQAAVLAEAATTSYTSWIVTLFKNRNFLALMISYGLNTGAFYALGTLLNQFILFYFEDETTNAGYIGVTIVLFGLLASIVFGLWLGWSGRYKETTFATYLMSFGSMIVFMLVLSFSGRIWAVFIAAAILGFFMTGYLPVGFELAAEITYPAPEGTSSGLLNCSAQIFGLILTSVMGVIVAKYSPLGANGLLAACLFIGAIITYFIKPDYRRSNISKIRLDTMTVSPSTATIATMVPSATVENFQSS